MYGIFKKYKHMIFENKHPRRCAGQKLVFIMTEAKNEVLDNFSLDSYLIY